MRLPDDASGPPLHVLFFVGARQDVAAAFTHGCGGPGNALISPYLKRGGEALSHQAKADVVPIDKPVRREKAPSQHRWSRMKSARRAPLKTGPVGHTSNAQKAKVQLLGCCRNCGRSWDEFTLDPAHVVARPHGGCDSELCVIGLCRSCHDAYDQGDLDILPLLDLDEQAHAVGHVGVLAALKRTTGVRDWQPMETLR